MNSLAEQGSSSDGGGPRPSARNKRAEILAVATDYFGHRGYEDTKWADVAGAVGVGSTALYHYFESKLHCLYVIMAEAVEVRREDFDRITAETDYLDGLDRVLRSAFELSELQVQRNRVLVAEQGRVGERRQAPREEEARQVARARTRDYEVVWATHLARGMEQGLVPEADPAAPDPRPARPLQQRLALVPAGRDPRPRPGRRVLRAAPPGADRPPRRLKLGGVEAGLGFVEVAGGGAPLLLQHRFDRRRVAALFVDALAPRVGGGDVPAEGPLAGGSRGRQAGERQLRDRDLVVDGPDDADLADVFLVAEPGDQPFAQRRHRVEEVADLALQRRATGAVFAAVPCGLAAAGFSAELTGVSPAFAAVSPPQPESASASAASAAAQPARMTRDAAREARIMLVM